MNCCHCSSPLEHVFLDLGFAPPSNAYLNVVDLRAPELYFPLKLFVCDKCWLVQTEDYSRSDELFTKDYAYFSSVSTTWLAHARSYVDMITAQLSLGSNSFVIEVASNDGYLLKNFVASGVPCLGIEPTDSTAAVAEAAGLPVAREIFRPRRCGQARKVGQTARPHYRQQRLWACARHQRFHGRHEDGVEARRNDHARVPAPHEPDTPKPVRHGLPRALLLLVAAVGQGDLCARRVK